MIDLPSTYNDANPFAAIITPQAITDILTKQVEKARGGDTAAANLVLKIVVAASGRDTSSRRNPDTPQSHPPTVQQVAVALTHSGPMNAHQLAARFGCDVDHVLLTLERSTRFAMNSRGVWSMAPVATIGEG